MPPSSSTILTAASCWPSSRAARAASSGVGVGVELERVERRNALGLRLGDGRQPRHQARIGLVQDVVAAAAPLPHGIEDDELGRHGAARDQQPVGLGDRPAQPVDARRRQPEGGERRVAHALQARQQAAVRLRRVGRAGDHDQNGEHADRRGQAGAQQPAEAAALARIGMVADVDVAERATRAAGDRRCDAVVRLARPQRGRVVDPAVRGAWCPSPESFPLVRLAGERRAGTGYNSAARGARLVPIERCAVPRRTAGNEPRAAVPVIGCALQCGPFCGKQFRGLRQCAAAKILHQAVDTDDGCD